MLQSRCQIRVRYAETDKMNVVYHSNYFVWFEAGRIQLLDEYGCPYIDLEAQGYMLPVLECSAKFYRPARFDDRLDIITTIAERPLLRIAISYQVKRGDELLAEGATLHAFVSPEGQPQRPPPDFVMKMKAQFKPKA